MKYVYALLIILFFWAVVGTGLAIIFSLIGINIPALGQIIGIILGIYIAYNKFKSPKKA